VALGEGIALENLLPVVRPHHRAADADVLERLLAELRDRDRADGREKFSRVEGRLPLSDDVEVGPSHDVEVLGGEIVAPGEPAGEPRGRVGMHPALDLIRIGQPGKEVIRVAHPCHARTRLVPLEHPGAGPDAGLGFLQITVLLDDLPGDDAHRRRRQRLEQPRVRLLEAELDRVTVERLDPVNLFELRAIGIARHGEEALVGVLDVLRRELSPVDRRLRVPPHTPAQLEDVGRLGRLTPRLRDVRLQWKRAGGDGWSGLDLHEAAVSERHGDLGAPVHRELVVEHGGLCHG